ncbi:dNTP triphosphohydrolase, partial [Alphaproteobacteria bacterium]|nr:dNTP triphosphohydrolase [Alphaproteobacteria bacterium]
MQNFLSASPNNSKGRFFDENDDLLSLRTPYERDRDRIIHANSFRKLKHKTQVFIESDSDYYRTRLTHSLEVAQIARSLCRALNLNEDLGEVVSLAHDLGHPPFGHNGERALNLCMKNNGGFNHNDQTLRVITKIEKRHPNFDGLNLTWESLEGIVKHNGLMISDIPFHTNQYNKIHNLSLNTNPHLESQIAAISDDVAYNNHDVEDAIRAGLINIKSLTEVRHFNNIIEEKQLMVVPYGDRSGTVIEPWLTDQWFCDAKKLSTDPINEIKNGNTKFIPKVWEKTFFNWMDNIQPWCISRQLWWGHQIPAWYGPDGKYFVSENYEEAEKKSITHYGKKVKLIQDEDVLDTWFSSALWTFTTLDWPEKTYELEKFYPGNVLVTGFDIIFFWVARMMMMGSYFMKKTPFKDIYIHPLIRDEKGQKMSKSKGNIIDPLVLLDKYGADTL